ncbi:hypothetical protein MYU51_013629 [Penicillium brevicompactum]|uniref:uncharacterized protein n=1 Tax=Penicillium brevicompactum TaxID=5074 RepID=UPI00254111EE|nr:uncharacterized protein N7506_011918 [Penicillium brevicompactum]KAJ5319214.1 hypothetical protein N7506_011918 [Penicillium brevicompactum]
MSADVPPPFFQRMVELTVPAQIISWAIPHYVKVFTKTIFKGQILAPISQTSKLRDEAFGSFWIEFSSPRQMTSDPNNTELPTPVGSSALIPPLLRTASGVVLDIGPGTGTQMPLLTSPSITALYGAEPCTSLHKALRAKAEAEGISSKYHILPTGVAAAELTPALRDSGVDVSSEGVFDTILCVRVLCSVPNMEKTVSELYGMLKPGGRILVTEHVVNPWRRAKGSLLARVAQVVYQALGWSWFIGDCALNRDIEKALRGAAGAEGWESVELERSFEWSAMPYISGTLVKRG